MLQGTARMVAEAVGRNSRLVSRLRPTYESVLDWWSGGRGIPWEINGVMFRVDPRNRHRLGQNYDAPVAAFLRERIRPGDTCIDVGANVGVYVLQFAHWSAPSGHVVAFEPNPDALRVLRQHVEWNGLQNRVEIAPMAVSDTPGHATLYAIEADGMSRLDQPNASIASEVKPLTVDVTTIDEFCERTGLKPDWMLIDIEGFEIEALRGARRVIGERADHLGIIVEIHPDVWRGTHDEAVQLFNELGVRPVPLTGQRDPLAEHGLVHLAHL